MTLAEFITSKLKSFQLSVSSGELEVILANHGETPNSALTNQTMIIAKQVIVETIPELLLMPDISQGDFSRKLDKSGVIAYYTLLCDELGLENKLARQPRIYDASNRW